MKAIDVATDTAGHAHALLDAGIEAVGLYLRQDRCSKAMVDGLALVGIKRFSAFERGFPTSTGYFTLAQAADDAQAAVKFAQQIGQPEGTVIFFAVDFDADQLSPILRYFLQVQQIVKRAGYLVGVYGSGRVCDYLVGQGVAHAGWLAQSKGWAGFEAYKTRAAIVQGGEDTLLGFDVDWDEVRDESVCW